MRKADLNEAILENHICAQLGTVIKYICDKHGISRQDFFVLLELHGKSRFTWDDFATAELTASWCKHRWYRFKNDGYVSLYRAKDGKFRKYNIYKVTRKTDKAVEEFYALLSGVKPLPDVAYNTNARYNTNRLARKLEKLKEDGTPKEET